MLLVTSAPSCSLSSAGAARADAGPFCLRRPPGIQPCGSCHPLYKMASRPWGFEGRFPIWGKLSSGRSPPPRTLDLPVGNSLGAGAHLTLQACLLVRPEYGRGSPLCTQHTVVSLLGAGVGARCSPLLCQRVRAGGDPSSPVPEPERGFLPEHKCPPLGNRPAGFGEPDKTATF